MKFNNEEEALFYIDLIHHVRFLINEYEKGNDIKIWIEDLKKDLANLHETD